MGLKTEKIEILTEKRMKNQFIKTARSQGMTLGSWARSVLLREVKSLTENQEKQETVQNVIDQHN